MMGGGGGGGNRCNYNTYLGLSIRYSQCIMSALHAVFQVLKWQKVRDIYRLLVKDKKCDCHKLRFRSLTC